MFFEEGVFFEEERFFEKEGSSLFGSEDRRPAHLRSSAPKIEEPQDLVEDRRGPGGGLSSACCIDRSFQKGFRMFSPPKIFP